MTEPLQGIAAAMGNDACATIYIVLTTCFRVKPFKNVVFIGAMTFNYKPCF